MKMENHDLTTSCHGRKSNKSTSKYRPRVEFALVGPGFLTYLECLNLLVAEINRFL